MKILAISGSPRLKGNTNYLVDQAVREAAKLGAETEVIVLCRYRVNPCLGHENCGSFESCLQKDDAPWILEKFCAADGVILATPVYYYNVSAQMKSFIDRNYFLYRHDLKPKARAAGFILVANVEGIEDAEHSLKQFTSASLDISSDKIFTIGGYANRPGEVKNQPALVEEARKLGRRIVASLKES